MNILQFFKHIFSIDTNSSNRIIIYILGLKIQFLKPWIKNSAKQFQKYDCPITEIPRATGALRKTQIANLKITHIFSELCEQNGLKYWLDCGNALGAFRHKGFIPWDDDVDLGMLREDYEKFIELFKDGIPNHDDIYIDFRNNGKNKCYLKIKHKLLENIEVEVFPYDYYYKKTTFDEKVEITKKIKKYMSSHKFLFSILSPIYRNYPDRMRKRFIDIRDKFILENKIPKPDEHPSLVFGMDAPHIEKIYLYDYETIFPLGTIEYEGYKMACPNNMHEFLTQIYGNYMELPDDCYPRHTNSDGFQGEMATIIDDFIKELQDKI